jgi:signal peptidase II
LEINHIKSPPELKKAVFIIVLILIIDQVVKIWVKTHMHLGQEYPIFGNWFLIHFTENEGMAFGMRLGGSYGKLLLSLFRIIAIIAISWWLYKVTRKPAPTGLIISISLVLAGAIGNILDSAFYGMIFSESTLMQVSTLFPEGGGYGTFLHGRVVDMLYFPIIEGHYPAWIPVFGGDDFQFFRPVFNVADSSITIGVLLMILFQKRFFSAPSVSGQPEA